MNSLPRKIYFFLLFFTCLSTHPDLSAQTDFVDVDLGNQHVIRIRAEVGPKSLNNPQPLKWDRENYIAGRSDELLTLELTWKAPNDQLREVYYSVKNHEGLEPEGDASLLEGKMPGGETPLKLEFIIFRQMVNLLISFTGADGAPLGQFEKEVFFEVMSTAHPETTEPEYTGNGHTAVPEPTPSQKAWLQARAANSRDAYQEFLKKFPESDYAPLATAAIDLLDRKDQAVDSLTTGMESQFLDQIRGRVIEFFPDTMYTLKNYRVSVQITSDTSMEIVRREIESNELLRANPDEVETYVIDGLGDEMKAILVDSSPENDKNFQITTIFENSIRPIDFLGGRLSRWEWDVYPLKKGQHQLSLVLERVVDKDKGDVFPILDKKITVLVEKNPYTLYLYLAAGLLVLGVAGIYLWLRARRKVALSFAFQPGDYEQIRTLVASNHTEEALSSLQKLELPKNYTRQTVILLSRLNRNSEKTRMGVSDEAALDIERNKINADLLDLVEEIKNAAR